MTVKELVEELQKLPPDDEVLVRDEDGHCHGINFVAKNHNALNQVQIR